MFTHYNGKFQKEVVIIHPGEFYATGEDKIISTVLGSCVAVAFHDRRLKLSGLNHFMLVANSRGAEKAAQSDAERRLFLSESGKYGMYAMELVINEMIKQGSRRRDLVAKVFGGGHVLRLGQNTGKAQMGGRAGNVQGLGSVSSNNVEFALSYLETEGIPIETADVGGTTARKILVFAPTFKVLLKRITGNLITEVKEEETEYLQRLERERAKRSEPTIF